MTDRYAVQEWQDQRAKVRDHFDRVAFPDEWGIEELAADGMAVDDRQHLSRDDGDLGLSQGTRKMTPQSQRPASTDPPEVVVRETACKTILNRTSLGDYSLNCYTGCEHACVYCYARFMQRFHPHPEAWGEFVDVKVNAVEALRRQLRHAEPAS